MRVHAVAIALALSVTPLLGGCDLFGPAEDPAKVAAAKEADGKAIGGACRHSGRALEDCYVLNPKALKSAIYAGWLEMDAYMRDNKIAPVVPDLVEPPVGGKATAKAEEPAGPAEEAKTAAEEKKPAADKKSAEKKSAKGAAYVAPGQPLPRRFT